MLAALAATVVFLPLPAGVALAQPPAAERPAYQTLSYDRAPRSITLPVGSERFVTFPSPVQFGMPPSLAGKLRTQAVDDTVYLRALEPFEQTRVAVRGLIDGRIYLLDLAASASGADTTPIRIVAAGTVPAGGDEAQALAAAAAAVPPAAEPAKRLPDVGYLELTRFAAQQLYAPQRLATTPPGVIAVPLAKIPATRQLLRGGGIEALPIASWRAANGLHVTAVMLRNTLPDALSWDPRLLRGDWRTAACMHAVLGPRGSATETSAMFLVHDGPFVEAAQPWLD
jgi:integrating conjugative element protein (TIGR03749 family)